MQKVHLIGDIAKFGSHWETECRTIPDIFKLIECQTPGFRKYLIEAAESGVGYEIRRGKAFVTEDTLLLSLGKEDIIITEVPAGAKSGGAKLLVAAAVVALIVMNPGNFFYLSGTATSSAGTTAAASSSSFALTTPGLIAASVAVNLALAGISQLLAPGPEVDGAETNESYLFNGPVNTAKQGIPVPVAYGELIVGGAPISVNYSTTPFGRNPFANYGPRYPDINGDGSLFSSSSGSGGEDACFIPDALVTMADGSTKRIQDVVVGDSIKGRSGTNTVLENNVSRVEARLYAMNSYSHFVTDTHPFLTTEGWKSFNPAVTNEMHPGLDVTKLEVGDELVTEAGTEILSRASKLYKMTPIFNLNVDGDDTYIVNGFVVHNK